MQNHSHSHQHHPGREPSTTSASSSTSSKTSTSKSARTVMVPADQLPLYNRQLRVPITRVHPHHLHHHPRFGYLYPADLEAAGGYPAIGSKVTALLHRFLFPLPWYQLGLGICSIREELPYQSAFTVICALCRSLFSMVATALQGLKRSLLY